MRTADEQTEIPLSGGRTLGVVRIGNTVRKPLHGPDAERVPALLQHFERRGFRGAQRFVGVDAQGRAILSFIDGFAPPHNGFRLSEAAIRAGAQLVRQVHDLTAGTPFAAGGEVACHPNLSQPNFILRFGDLVPVAIIDWDGTAPGSRLHNLGEFLWAFVHPAMFGDGERAAYMLRAAIDAYGWRGGGDLVEAMLAPARNLYTAATDSPGVRAWAAAEVDYLERNAALFRTAFANR
jgi:hypothetical protein